MIQSSLSYAEHALRVLFESLYNIKDVKLSLISGSGSDRVYFRMSAAGISCIGTFVPDDAEGRCFVRLAENFRKWGVAVPKIYAVSKDFHCYLQEDLGDKSLFSSLNDPGVEPIIKETLSRLVAFQKTPESVWKEECINRDFSRRQVMWDLNYFKYEYLKPRNIIFNEDLLEDDFEKLSSKLIEVSDEFCGFMMRDCQSRNVMIAAEGPVFIDFQGGRRGPSLYDAVSFLWQARAGFSDGFRKSMLEFYCNVYCDADAKKIERMLSIVDDIVLFRTLQVLGAYGFRGLVQNKSHFLLSIPGALDNLKALLNRNVIDDYPELKLICEALVSDPMFVKRVGDGRLVVEVFSFSYKKGYPKDLSGNGGGFMFDCRALHNPGRYKEYKELTGKDEAVIDFLEKRGEIQSFLHNAWAITDPAIERYLTRGFTHIQIGFGCTGGQHRSVYSAEHTATHIRTLFPEADVKLTHLEHP
ncbi:MAG: phosphotransferase [Muribaculaceae bacterium]|nr:phosphotransferase [Muribaculaceae bacterium]